MELNLLNKCNLKCLHCYIGKKDGKEISLEDAVKITKEFAEIGGLRILITGGEPLLYKKLPEYIEQTSDLKLRRVLFSNGTLINSKNIEMLKIDEIQFSLDGWEKGHDKLRGTGTFRQTINSIYTTKKAGMDISVATMIHQYNLDEFERIRYFVEEIETIDWGIDVMTIIGSLTNHKELAVPYKIAVPFLEYGYGGGYHGSSDGYTCGRHSMAIMPDGNAVKCSFYKNDSLGYAPKSLKDCWLNVKHIHISELECKDCSVIEECKGGCRFRASHPLTPDSVMCVAYGIIK